MKSLLMIFGLVKNEKDIYKIALENYAMYDLHLDACSTFAMYQDEESEEVVYFESFTKEDYNELIKEEISVDILFKNWTNDEFLDFLRVVDGELLEPNGEFLNAVEEEIHKRVNEVKISSYYRDYSNEDKLKTFIAECYEIMKLNRKKYLDKVNKLNQIYEFALEKFKEYSNSFASTYQKYIAKLENEEEYFEIENLDCFSYYDIVYLIDNDMFDFQLLNPEKSNMQTISDIIEEQISNLCDAETTDYEDVEEILAETFGTLIKNIEDTIKLETNKRESLKNISEYLKKKQEELKSVDAED